MAITRNGMRQEFSSTRGAFRNGKKNGIFKSYVPSALYDLYGRYAVGKLKTTSTYSDDVLNGVEQMFTHTVDGKQHLIAQKSWTNWKAA